MITKLPICLPEIESRDLGSVEVGFALGILPLLDRTPSPPNAEGQRRSAEEVGALSYAIAPEDSGCVERVSKPGPRRQIGCVERVSKPGAGRYPAARQRRCGAR